MTIGPAAASPITAPEPGNGTHRSRWFVLALVSGAIFWLLAWYLDTGQTMVAIWSHSETFAHGFLIAPISAWLVWRRRHALAALDLRPNFYALLPLALVGFGWLLGRLAVAGVVQQYALVVMIPLVVWTILGNQVVRALGFPLLFLLFAVPAGEFLTPMLMEHTADFIVFALRLSGIPVFREGQFFTIPSGSWSVVEACSGLRYLIASVTLGFLYAYLTYRSLARRALFVAASVVVPILANWLRAYMIVMIGHLSSMKYAVGIDHLIYGWVFFGIVMLILFWVGSFWRQDLAPGEAREVATATHQRGSSLEAILAATVAAAVTVALWPALGESIEGAGPYATPALRSPAASGGWRPAAAPLADWVPGFSNPRASVNQTYADGTQRAGLYIGYYRNQQQGSPLISSQNVLVSTENREWANIGESRLTVDLNNETIPVIEARLRGRSAQLLVWQWYWVDGQFIVNPYWAKLLQARSRLFGRGDDGAVVIAYTELDRDRSQAAGRLRDFVRAMVPEITRSLDVARRVQPGT